MLETPFNTSTSRYSSGYIPSQLDSGNNTRRTILVLSDYTNQIFQKNISSLSVCRNPAYSKCLKSLSVIPLTAWCFCLHKNVLCKCMVGGTINFKHRNPLLLNYFSNRTSKVSISIVTYSHNLLRTSYISNYSITPPLSLSFSLHLSPYTPFSFHLLPLLCFCCPPALFFEFSTTPIVVSITRTLPFILIVVILFSHNTNFPSPVLLLHHPKLLTSVIKLNKINHYNIIYPNHPHCYQLSGRW